jgi:capsular exopolysaccharide synthesis family protein
VAQPNLLLEEIRRLQETRESGVLALTKMDQRVNVSYREGVIQAVSSNLDSHRLGAYLIREGFLSDADVPRVLGDARREKILFGEAAVRRKYLDAPELADIIRRQAAELLKHAFKNSFERESFTRGLRSYYIPANINVAFVLLELSRSNMTPFDATPATIIALKTGEDLSGVPWLPKELCVLGELSRATTIAALLESTGIDEPALRRILGVLDRLGILETVRDEQEADSAIPAGVAGNSALIRQTSFPFDRLVPVVTNAVIGDKLEVIRNPSSFISEQFKTLKVRIREDCENPPQVMTISSPDQQDGKSLISANLGIALSMEAGRRTVIIDCDLRNPTLSKHLGVSAEPGLIQYLSNGQMPPYCYMRRMGNLFFLTSGGISENPIELLSLRKMKDLIEKLKVDFDTVILDAPPFSPIADARVVSGLGDGLIMVIRRGKTSLGSIENAFKILDQSKLLGVVFNDVKPMLFNTYFNRGYYHYGVDSRYLYSGNRKSRTTPKNYLES